MRILYVINHLLTGGAETLFRGLVLGLMERNFKPEITVLATTDSFIERDLRRRGFHIRCATPGASKLGLGLIAKIYSPIHALELARDIRMGRYDLVHCHLFPAQLHLSFAHLLSGSRVPMITTEHSTANRRRRLGLRFLDHSMYSRYAAITCVSPSAANEIIRWEPALAPKIHVIPNGIDVERFAQAAAAPLAAFANRRPLALCVGRLDIRKGYDVAIRAVARIPGIHLALVGEGPEHGSLERLAASLQVSTRVHFLGGRENIPEILKNGDFLLHPARSEGFGLAVLEAMSAGIPVICTDIPGLHETVGNSALRVKPDDPEALACAMRQLLSNARLKETLQTQGLLHARNYSIGRSVERYIDLYEKCRSALRPN